VTAFDSNGRIQEVVLGDESPVYLEPRSEEELELLAPSAPTYASTFGSAGSGNGQFAHPAGIAVDSKGTIWVVDQDHDRVEKFNVAGEFQSAFGSSGTGNGQFGRPADIAVDAAGNLWVTDPGNHRVEKFNEKGEFLAKFGSYGTGNGQFNAAESIAIDPQGNIWIGDTYNGRLQKFNSAFEFIKVVGSKGSGAGQMNEATGIDIGLNGDVWVADWGNNRVSVFNSNGEVIRQFGSSGTGDGQFARPDVIEVDSRGNVWVGDQNNSRVQQFNQAGKYVDQFGTKGSGQGQFSFSWPMGIASDTKGNLWVADTGNNRVQRWGIPAYVPTYSSVFGSSGTGNSQFNHPADVAIDSQGNLWVPDKLNHRIQKFNSEGEFVAKYGSSGSGAGQLSGPSSIAFDAAGNFWVAERNNNRLQKFNAGGESLKIVGTSGSGNGQFSGPEGIVIAPNGHIFVSDTYNHRVQELNSNGEFIKVVNPGGLGAIEPTGIAADANGNVWVTDWSNNRVVEFSEAGALIRSFGTSGTGDGQFNRPDAVEVDAQGKVWVGDQNNGRIQIFNQNAEFVTKFGGVGSGAGQFSFSYPFGFAVTASGVAWIADANNNRIQRWRSSGKAPGSEEKVLAPYFDPPVVDYEYANGKLEAMQLEDEATEGADPELDLVLSANKVTEVESEEAGDTTYSYVGTRMTAADSSAGETKYVYDGSERLTSVTLPNGTTAAIVYDETSRATSVKVDPAGPEAAKTTNFSYQAEPRRTKVWGGGNPEITYDIADDGSVLKWAWAETPPTIASISGSLWSKKGLLLENKDQTLFVTGSSPHQVASIKVVVDGSSVVEEKTCADPASPPSHVCDQPAPLEWITHPSEHPAGRMDVEVIVEDFLGRQTAERFSVYVPQQPPPDPVLAERPNFKAIKSFREAYGLDRNKPLTEPQMNELVLELLYEWEGREPTAMRAVESWGMPMRAPELAEMEWRRQFVAQAGEAIPQWASENAPSTYAGFYVDEREGSKIYVGFTQNQAALVESLKASGGLINPNAVSQFPIAPTRSIASLLVTEDSVAQAIYANAAVKAATSSVSVGTNGNVVTVGATNVSLVSSFITQQFGANAPISVVPEPAGELLGLTRFPRSGPVYGGAGLFTGSACTAGFGARDPGDSAQRGSQDLYFVLTAGHCAPKLTKIERLAGRTSFSGAGDVGTVRRRGIEAENFGDVVSIDAEAVLVNKDLATGSVLNGNPLVPEPIQGAMQPRIGRTVCWSGVYGGQQCGRIIRREPFPGLEGSIQYLFLVGGSTAKGDSGGPVWDRDAHRAVGVITAGAGPSWILPATGSRMFTRMRFTPLLPRQGEELPEGALPKLGLDILKGE
jgi:tripartite motif-containing protein 71